MDTFFRRHFKRKEAALLPLSKARRRSNAGLPSGALTQRRRSSAHLQPAHLGKGVWACEGGGACEEAELQHKQPQVHCGENREEAT
ncbi:Diacylglycerol kinase zeta [Dissostichus eleginoides]|uniref:Diacylglycerol kinase zeta n=1 Tax=Dissostichus eleginoides TaxID=100907 RepID=A0AAD9ERQ4_DISEL|nr:Diacylglycerol kinase zeta [Dissostichus eleginoides]